MVAVSRLWLQDFRNIVSADLYLDAGRIIATGQNGQGKSNLIEAIAYLGSLSSFRGVPAEALIREGTDTAVVRAELLRNDRKLLIEATLMSQGQNQIQVNKQKLRGVRDLCGLLPVTVFGPDDLSLIKAGPAVRRDFLDDLLVKLHPRNFTLTRKVNKILKQRNALLRSAKGRFTDEIKSTLVVWNEKLGIAGDELGKSRRALVAGLTSRVQTIYADLSGNNELVSLKYEPFWLTRGLRNELEVVCQDELRRGTTLVGPHRDELDIYLKRMPARTHASQGEQRTLSLALRIAGHRELAETVGTKPLLLLDDVFSELDENRSAALMGLLEADQTFITTATELPLSIVPSQKLKVVAGEVVLT